MKFPGWWLRRTWASWSLLPFSWVFGLIASMRYLCYKRGFFNTYSSRLPVIIVGNISVGGTGKTPLVIALVNELKKKGIRPAVISRGYKSEAKAFPLLVTRETPVNLSGDEPLLIARHTQCPVIIDPNRVRAVKFLEELRQCDVIISDDGLQHYALNRDIEILVVDGQRQFGNGWLLPAGMLREPASRMARVDLVVYNGKISEKVSEKKPFFTMNLQFKQLISLSKPERTISIAQFKHQKVHAVAGIGHPERFFALLREYELDIIPHPFPDHHSFTEDDFTFLKEHNLPVIMTEKDAVKCAGLLYDGWFVEIEAILPEAFYEGVGRILRAQTLLQAY